MRTRTVAIIGGGPAGAMAAARLAAGSSLRHNSGGLRVLVLQDKMGWEKPCGGGLTHKALRRYPFLADTAKGANLLREAEFIASTGTAMRVRLREPLAIYPRTMLDGFLLRRAAEAGAEIVNDRVLGVTRKDSHWELAGRDAGYRADFAVLAAGARSRLRQVFADDFGPRDFMLTLGYHLPVDCERLRVQFYEKFEGYAWAFPRADHVSVGVCGKAGDVPMTALRERLAEFLRKHGYAPDRQRIFSHLLPSLTVDSWAALRLAGPGWALVGDAAGLVDPLTGEGIYYAMRSGELLAEALLDDFPEDYPERVRNEFGRALAQGARMARMFYHGEFAGAAITTRMIELGAQSRALLDLIQDLIEGVNSYPELLARIQVGLARALLDVGRSRLSAAFALHLG